MSVFFWTFFIIRFERTPLTVLFVFTCDGPAQKPGLDGGRGFVLEARLTFAAVVTALLVQHIHVMQHFASVTLGSVSSLVGHCTSHGCVSAAR